MVFLHSKVEIERSKLQRRSPIEWAILGCQRAPSVLHHKKASYSGRCNLAPQTLLSTLARGIDNWVRGRLGVDVDVDVDVVLELNRSATVPVKGCSGSLVVFWRGREETCAVCVARRHKEI